MNSQKYVQTLMALVAMFFGVFVVISSLASGGNSLAASARYLGPVAFALSFINGRLGLHLLIFTMAYSDLVKRFLIEYGGFSFMDITSVLMIAPIVMMATLSHFVIARFIQNAGAGKLNDRVLLISICASGLLALSLIARFGVGLGALKEIAHQAAYIPLVWVVLVALRTREEVISFVKFLIILFIPVALYGMKQGLFGFTDFEMRYLLSGFTTEAKHLREEEIHAFSTMSSSVPFGVIMGMMAGLCLFYRKLPKKGGGGGSSLLFGILTVVFLVGAFFSMKKSAWVVSISVISGVWIFQSRILTRLAYSFAAVAFLMIVVFAKSILKNWGDVVTALESVLPDGVAVSTLSARVAGIYNWSRNPEMWTLTGVPVEKRESAEALELGSGLKLDSLSTLLAHDAIGFTLLNYGAPALFIIIILGIYVARSVHGVVSSATTANERACYAILLAVIVGGIISGLSNKIIFPVNAMSLLVFGFFLRLKALSLKEKAQKAISDPVPLFPRGGMARREFGRHAS